MNLAVTGGRDVHVSDEDFAWLMSVYKSCGATHIILGDCPTGVDKEVHDRLVSKYLRNTVSSPPWSTTVADWTKHGKAAGPIRNQVMIDEADALAAFNGGRGTADCVRRAKAKGIPVFTRQATGAAPRRPEPKKVDVLDIVRETIETETP